MQENTDKLQSQQESQKSKPVAKPNERAGVAVMGHVKIFDPNSQEVIVETRA
jgi:hypothetical protein